jgi:hypothetical protein
MVRFLGPTNAIMISGAMEMMFKSHEVLEQRNKTNVSVAVAIYMHVVVRCES